MKRGRFEGHFFPDVSQDASIVLPRHILSYLACFLTVRDRVACLQVCKVWTSAFRFTSFEELTVLGFDRGMRMSNILRHLVDVGVKLEGLLPFQRWWKVEFVEAGSTAHNAHTWDSDIDFLVVLNRSTVPAVLENREIMWDMYDNEKAPVCVDKVFHAIFSVIEQSQSVVRWSRYGVKVRICGWNVDLLFGLEARDGCIILLDRLHEQHKSVHQSSLQRLVLSTELVHPGMIKVIRGLKIVARCWNQVHLVEDRLVGAVFEAIALKAARLEGSWGSLEFLGRMRLCWRLFQDIVLNNIPLASLSDGRELLHRRDEKALVAELLAWLGMLDQASLEALFDASTKIKIET